MKVTDGIRRIIEDWHDKGVSPEDTAQSLRIPIDEVRAIILQAHPAPPQPKRPEFLEPRMSALEETADVRDNRKES
ncbi:RNA polymerase subunit sigma [Bifidobacterium imperatoris]|uniref:RNA polymerase subunit sigma n=1 Tax=Bifidobacterium imperatoris TaxID=2020965 RepID=A0A2N5ISN6_9BIFI|nr:RNA polymerase subunit sigma [Bifidobacterium imperatoris]PLS24970.1 DNA-directed RNA polymerase subunit sigma [Bifidobacterium imperatoris]QSY58609.1 RNA polymerase subunit sigma [Bifidobacterium imperatoris]